MVQGYARGIVTRGEARSDYYSHDHYDAKSVSRHKTGSRLRVGRISTLGPSVPLKDFRWLNPRWYEKIRWLKLVFLWIDVVLILIGAGYFARGIWPVSLQP